MIPDRLVISMISPNSIPKIFVIARTDTTHEKISKALYTEPFQLVHLSDEQKYFDVVDELETACVLVAVSGNPEEELDVIASLQADTALARTTDIVFQVHSVDPPHAHILRSIELTATHVAPALGWVRKQPGNATANATAASAVAAPTSATRTEAFA